MGSPQSQTTLRRTSTEREGRSGDIKMTMNFEGFQDLMRRIARAWYERAKAEIIEMNMVNNYLKESPFVAKQTPENELAYEKLMDVRLKMVDLSYEIDRNHDAYMRFMGTTLNSMDLKNKICKTLKTEERNLVDLELMIMEQVQDWELDVGKTTAESNWDKVQDMIVTLPDDTTSTIRITAEPQRRSWFGLCPVSMKIQPEDVRRLQAGGLLQQGRPEGRLELPQRLLQGGLRPYEVSWGEAHHRKAGRGPPGRRSQSSSWT